MRYVVSNIWGRNSRIRNLWYADMASFMEKFNPARDVMRVLLIRILFTCFTNSVACEECTAIEIKLSYLRKFKVGNPLVFYSTYLTTALQLYTWKRNGASCILVTSSVRVRDMMSRLIIDGVILCLLLYIYESISFQSAWLLDHYVHRFYEVLFFPLHFATRGLLGRAVCPQRIKISTLI